MNKIVTFSIFILLVNTHLANQVGIDYNPKSLQNELEKLNGTGNLLDEMPLSEEINRQIYLGKFYRISSTNNTDIIKYVYIGRVKTCRAGGCSIIGAENSDKESEFFDYFILYDAACTILKVKIYNYAATHGQEVTSKNWLKQFENYKGDKKLEAGKNVDAISGATISVDALAEDIEHKTSILQQTLQMH